MARPRTLAEQRHGPKVDPALLRHYAQVIRAIETVLTRRTPRFVRIAPLTDAEVDSIAGLLAAGHDIAEHRAARTDG